MKTTIKARIERQTAMRALKKAQKIIQDKLIFSPWITGTDGHKFQCIIKNFSTK